MPYDLTKLVDSYDPKEEFNTRESILNEGLEKNPDSYAKTAQIAEKANQPVELVEGNEKNTETDIKKNKALEWYELKQENPVLFQTMKNAKFAGQAHDDIPQLSAMEKLFYHIEKTVPLDVSPPVVVCIFTIIVFFIIYKTLRWVDRSLIKFQLLIKQQRLISFEKKCITLAIISTLFALYIELEMSILPVIFLLYWMANLDKKNNL